MTARIYPVRLSTLDFSQHSDNQIVVPRRRISSTLRRSRPYTRPMNSDRIETPMDLGNIYAALQQEAYFQIAINKHITLCVRHGFDIVGNDEAAVLYVKKRLFDMAATSGISTNRLIRSVVRNLVLYSNAFLAKVRDSEKSIGRTMIIDDKPRQPVAALFPQNPRIMSAEKNKWGKLVAFRDGDAPKDRIDQILKQIEHQGTVKDDGVTVYPLHNMVHFPYNKEEGFVFGSPLWGPAIEDINALRRMEEDAEHMVRENSFTKLHLSVGSDENPALPADIEQRRQTLYDMEPGEAYISGHDEKLAPVATNRGVDPSNSLEHFENRVFSGLNVSAVELGRGGTANRGTASSIMQQRIEICKDFQATVEETFLTQIIWELLAEHTGNLTIPPGDVESMVALKFTEIDVDQEIAKHTHWVDMYSKNAVTRTEMRAKVGMSEIADEEDFMVNHVTLEVARVTAEAVAEVSPDTVNHPTNQHGTKTSNGIQQNDSVKSISHGIEFDREISQLESKVSCAWRSEMHSLSGLLHKGEIEADLVRHLLPVALFKSVMDDLYTLAGEDVIRIVAAHFMDIDFLEGVDPKSESVEENTITALEGLRDKADKEARKLLNKITYLAQARQGIHVIRAVDESCADSDGQILPNATYNEVPPHHHNCKCILETVETDHRPRMDPVPTIESIIASRVPTVWMDTGGFPQFTDLFESIQFLMAFLMDRRSV